MKAPLEIAERDTPYRYIRCEWITDSAGDGEFRGAVGTQTELVNEHDPTFFVPGDAMVQTGNSDGEKFEHFGLLGGSNSPANQAWIKRRGQTMVLRMQDMVNVEPGDIIETKSGGGGGVGDPLNRDIEKVRMDAMNRYISVKKAKDVYGVVINASTFEIDFDATVKLRAVKKSTKEEKSHL